MEMYGKALNWNGERLVCSSCRCEVMGSLAGILGATLGEIANYSGVPKL